MAIIMLVGSKTFHCVVHDSKSGDSVIDCEAKLVSAGKVKIKR